MRQMTMSDCLNDPEKVFRHYCIERERIRFKKDAGNDPMNLTQDVVLKEWKFCNIFREDDKVTKHYLKWIEPLAQHVRGRSLSGVTPDVIVAIVANTQMYRTINWPPTLNNIGLLGEFLPKGKKEEVAKMEWAMHQAGEKTCTGAYLLPQCGRKGDRKVVVVMDSVEEVYDRKNEWMPVLLENRLEDTWRWFRHHISMSGPFIAYEVITDLSYNLLRDASDRYTWANAGPGALRGINRLRGRDKKTHMKPDVACKELQYIMKSMRTYFEQVAEAEKSKLFEQSATRVNMRTAEHTMCEYDKYCRVLCGHGTPRARYKPTYGEFDVR